MGVPWALVPKVTTSGLVLVVCLALTACSGDDGGGGGDKTFQGDGYSFTYPGEWDEREVDEITPGALLLTAFAPTEGLNALIFEVSDAGQSITESNIDSVAEDVAGALQESTEGPTRVTVAGLPGLRIISYPQSDLTRRITTVFDRRTAYVFDCGFTPERADEMKRGCEQAEKSFQVE